MKEKTSRIGVSLPPKLLDRFDEMIDGMGYANRSEAIRDAVREYIYKNKLREADEKAKGIGVISLIYDHHLHGVTESLTDLQHNYCDVIQSNTHIHLDHHNCMELIIVEGKITKIQDIKNQLTATAGVKHSDLLINPVEE